MSKIILDAELLAKLGGLHGRVALYDQYGNLKAYIDPVPGAIPPRARFHPGRNRGSQKTDRPRQDVRRSLPRRGAPMNFEVRLRDSAADEMLVQYVRAANKPAIFAASGRIERELGDDPHSAGEERSGSTRGLVVRPLLVMYLIADGERVVFIERIRWVGL